MQSRANNVEIFGTVATPAAAIAQLPRVKAVRVVSDTTGCDAPDTWSIRCNAIEAQEQTAVPVGPLTRSQIRDQGRPVSTLQARITLGTGAQDSLAYDVDIGAGVRVHATCANVSVDVLVPQNAVQVAAGASVGTRVGLVVNSSVAASLARGIRAAGRSRALLSQTIALQPAADNAVEIPAGAAALTYYQSAGTPASLFWNRGALGAPSILVGRLLGPGPTGDRLRVPIDGRAKTVVAQIAGAAVVAGTFVWEIWV